MNGEQTVLVTGGSGFLGGWCAVEALRQGYRVRTTVRDLSREQEVRANIATQLDPGGRLDVVQADLLSEDGWAQAVAGCRFVLHVASPFPEAQPKDPDELIVPAREGALRVLRESLDAGAERIVMTSSVAAVRNSRDGALEGRRQMDEADWSDAADPRMSPYAKSKTLAERAAWELVRERGASERLVTIQPGAIVGPLLGADRSYSLQAVARLLEGGMPGLPRMGFSFIDVRDVASLHVLAMTAPAAGGQRLIAASDFLWFSDVAEILREELGEDAEKVPTRKIPNFVVRGMALVDPGIRSVASELGHESRYSIESAKSRTGWEPRPVRETIVDCAHSLLAHPATVPAAG